MVAVGLRQVLFDMFAQVALLRKKPVAGEDVAEGASVRFLVCMDPEVVKEVVPFFEE